MNPNIQYLGEHLIFGQVGHWLIAIAFAAALFSSLAYFFSNKEPEISNSWRVLARVGFTIHIASVVGIATLLFFLIQNHYYEYHYVWQHSSNALPLKYMFSCFWEGQEGSFLLWTMWHLVLGGIIMLKGGEWESGVMSVITMVQAFLCTMLVGVYIGDYKLGSDPFILLRDHPDMSKLPFIQMPDYLGRITDGRGLNPLLQNYWMTIHPPTLFLGFASTLIPFAYAIAGLLKKKSTEWIAPALPWTFFGIMILGTGILMGGAWAYESLSFGGFWAWDPVENASLVPWLTFVGAGHVMLIYKSRKQSVLSAILLSTGTFLLILYSTFLTRSGILGNASVHAFTDLGMSGQLVFYMLFFVVLTVVLLIINWKSIPQTKEEESLYSREFWMFIGVLVLLISCLQIAFETSKPVYNKLFDLKLAPPPEVIDHYNKWQLPIAVILGILIGATIYFRWKESSIKDIVRKLLPSFIVSVVLTTTISILGHFDRIHYIAMLFSSMFGVIANVDYLIRIIKLKWKVAGAPVAHIGFSLILLGALVSNGKRETISINKTNIDLGEKLPNNENVMLTRDDTVAMGDYYISYKGYKREGVYIHYQIDYLKADFTTGKFHKEFSLYPTLQLNERMGNSAEPDTKHFWHKDIYTHVTYVNVEELTDTDTTSEYKTASKKTLHIGDTVATGNYLMVFKGIDKNPDKKALHVSEADLAVVAELEFVNINKQKTVLKPVFALKDQYVLPIPAESDTIGIRVTLDKINPDKEEFEFSVAEKRSKANDFIVMKAMIFPGINLLWTGCIVMIIGTIIAIRKRVAEAKGK